MKVYELRLSKESGYDIEEACEWYERQRKGLSSSFLLSIEAGLNTIKRSPHLNAKKYKDCHVHYISRFPFGIHYIIEEEVIFVQGVFHTSRSPRNWELRNKS